VAIRILRIDDIDGTDSAEQTIFELDGVEYEIDLSARNRARLFRAIRPFVDRARSVGGDEESTASAASVTLIDSRESRSTHL
jgi:hypothetical protein